MAVGSYTALGPRLVFFTDHSSSMGSWGFVATYTCRPTAVRALLLHPSLQKHHPKQRDQPINLILSNQDLLGLSNKTHGGFIHLSMGPMVDGASQSYNLIVTNYKGLKPPSFFIGVNRVPRSARHLSWLCAHPLVQP